MTDKEIVQALRQCAKSDCSSCGMCPIFPDRECVEHLATAAASLIERLTAENAALREKVYSMSGEWCAMMSVLNSLGSYDRLRELAEADKGGRVVVLPCKVGDTVWRIKRTFETYPDKSKPYIEPDAFLLQDVFNIGKTVFLTREEAEKALAKMEDKKNG